MKNLRNIKIAIVSSEFRSEVAGNLEKNCLTTLKRRGLKPNQISVIRVPGSWEIPLAVKILAKKGGVDAIIAFGAIVKGQTYHFEQISNEVAGALMQIALDFEIPIVFEVWSVYKLKDAADRATRKKENKGVEAALTALKMIKTLSQI